MSFFDHLEELRWHILRSAAAIIFFTVAAFVNKHIIFDILLFGPSKPDFPTYKFLCNLSESLGLGDKLCISNINFEIINLEMAGQFLVHLKTSFAVGIVVAFPYAFWEIWRFVKPGLYDKEIRHTRWIVFFSSLLFFSGVAFGYFILMPFAVNFFSNYSISGSVANQFSLTNYSGFITMFVLASGILFELPMVVYFLSKLGLVTPELMREHRKHAFIAILILSALITPADVGTQLLVATPVYFLYEVSIFISKRVVDTRRKREKEEEEEEEVD